MHIQKSSPHTILKTFADDLKLPPIGGRTEEAYYACVRQLSEHYDKSPKLAVKLHPDELIRRFVQHLLPQGYCRVRCFGWLRPTSHPA